MKSTIILLIAFACAKAFGQTVFVRQNGTTSVYTSISSVFAAATNGDTIHLPGGSFNIGTLLIDKKLTIFGAGHHPDSTAATYATTLSGNITFKGTAASNSMLTGVVLTGTLQFGTNSTDSDISGFILRRCQIGQVVLSYNGSTPSLATNTIIDGNTILGNIIGANSQFVYVQNNLITGMITGFNGNLLVRNNTFLGGFGCSSVFVSNLTSGVFENNVFMNNGACSNATISSDVYSSIFTKNVFNANYSFPVGTNLGNSNYTNISLTGFFVNETDYNFSYTNDYHLSASGTYTGTDGSSCGMFGGFTPYKPGAVPVNPHISTKTIAPQTNTSGELNIQVTVGAQNN